MIRSTVRRLADRLSGARRSPSRGARHPRSVRFRPSLEPLEALVLLAQVTWIGPDNGDWGVPANWRDDAGVNRLPGSGDDAVINSGRVHYSRTDTVHSLRATGSLFIDGGALTVATASRISTPTLARGTTLAVTSTNLIGAVSNEGTVVMKGPNNEFSTVTGSGTLTIAGDDSVDGAVSTNYTVRNSSTIVLSATNTHGASLSVRPGFGMLMNEGTITTAGASNGGRSIIADFRNPGMVKTESGGLNITLTGMVNTGELDAMGGDIVVGGINNNGGTISINSGRTLSCDGTFTYNGGDVIARGTFLLPRFGATTLSRDFSPRGELMLRGTPINGPGKLINPADGFLLLLGSGMIRADVQNLGLLVVAGNLTVNGSFSAENESSLVLAADNDHPSAVLTFANGFINNGTITLRDDTNPLQGNVELAVTGGTLINATGRQIKALAGSAAPALKLNAELDNRGTVTTDGAGLWLNRSFAAHVNTGTFNLQGGDVKIESGTFTTSGPIQIGQDRVFLANSAFRYNGGTVGGPGALIWGGGANLAQDFSNASLGALTLAFVVGGTGTLTNATDHMLTVLDGQISTPFVNQGTVNVLNGLTLSQPGTIGGSLFLAADSVLAPQADLTITGVISGDGGLSLSTANTVTLSGNNTYTGPTTVTAGTLLVNGAQPASDMTVSSQDGTLGGSGTVGGITATNGTVSPGTGPRNPGILSASRDVRLAGDVTFAVKLLDDGAGIGYDQLDVTGVATLDERATLSLSVPPDFLPLGDRFRIITTTAGETGTFLFLPDGSIIQAGGFSFRINYALYTVDLYYLGTSPAPGPGNGVSDAPALIAGIPLPSNVTGLPLPAAAPSQPIFQGIGQTVAPAMIGQSEEQVVRVDRVFASVAAERGWFCLSRSRSEDNGLDLAWSTMH